MFCCSGILFNHESERRGETFVTRKITFMIEEDTRAAEHIISLTILLDNPDTILLGNSV